MAWLNPHPVNLATTTGFEIPSTVRPADPFNPLSITWTEVASSTAEEWAGFYVNFYAPSMNGAFHVAVGAAGSEVIIASVPTKIGNRKFFSHGIPISVPLGSRVAVGAAGNSAGNIIGQLLGVPSDTVDSLPPFTKLEFGPFDMTTDFGIYGRPVVVDPGAVANTKGVWTEISQPFPNNVLNGDSIEQNYSWFGFMMSDTSTLQAAHTRLWDISTGAAGAEGGGIVAGNIYDYYGGEESGILETGIQWSAQNVNIGTRLSARMQNTTVDAADRLGTIYFFGLR